MSKLTIFIDEAGDPGVRDGLRYLGNRHEWLAISAVAMRSSREPKVVDWVKELREVARSRQSGILHYHRVTRERRVGLCEHVARLPIRAFVMLSHKSNLREYINPRIRAQMDDGTFYNWCFRLLIERVTAWAHTWMLENEDRVAQPMHVIFARRGGHDYTHFFSYLDTLRWQKAQGKLLLRGPGLEEPTLDQTLWEIAETDEFAGLQVADVVASAFYQGANSSSPAFDYAPAQALQPVMASRKGVEANVGVTVFPLPQQAPLPVEARPLFKAYGYNW